MVSGLRQVASSNKGKPDLVSFMSSGSSVLALLARGKLCEVSMVVTLPTGW